MDKLKNLKCSACSGKTPKLNEKDMYAAMKAAYDFNNELFQFLMSLAEK